MHAGFWSEGFKEKDKSEYAGVDRIILKQIIQMGWVWNGFITPVAGPCEKGNEPSSSKKFVDF
jgi:hypothetical protein